MLFNVMQVQVYDVKSVAFELYMVDKIREASKMTDIKGITHDVNVEVFKSERR